MSQGFSLKYDRMKGNGSDIPAAARTGIERHDHAAHDRKLCFILVDGSSLRLNYAYLIWEEFYPEENRIILSFTSHTVTLTGQHLSKLYEDLMQNMPRIVPCMAARYNPAAESDGPIVNDIKISIN
jgi:hypothetical protein